MKQQNKLESALKTPPHYKRLRKVKMKTTSHNLVRKILFECGFLLLLLSLEELVMQEAILEFRPVKKKTFH